MGALSSLASVGLNLALADQAQRRQSRTINADRDRWTDAIERRNAEEQRKVADRLRRQLASQRARRRCGHWWQCLVQCHSPRACRGGSDGRSSASAGSVAIDRHDQPQCSKRAAQQSSRSRQRDSSSGILAVEPRFRIITLRSLGRCGGRWTMSTLRAIRFGQVGHQGLPPNLHSMGAWA